MRILVVDDEQDLCEILQYNLETEGYEVTTANSAEEALELPLHEYGLILLDVMMGEMSGFQMARRLKDGTLRQEYLCKHYAKDAFSDCSSVDAMIIYKQKMKNEQSFIESISYLSRYDWMQDHSSGTNGFIHEGSRLSLTDAERHRMTLGATFHVRNPYFPTDLRLNYEKYWYPHGGAKESEQDKVVCEVMIKF